MKRIFFVFTAMLLGCTLLAQNTNKIISSYNDVKNALVNGNSKAASEAAIAFQETVKSEAAFPQKSDLLKAIDEMVKASGIEKQRETLNDVSTILWKVVKSSDKVSQPVYYQYCPMKKTYWLSKEKEIKNPYYGSSMLTCGKIVETKQ
jgi:hypothetical protein